MIWKVNIFPALCKDQADIFDVANATNNNLLLWNFPRFSTPIWVLCIGTITIYKLSLVKLTKITIVLTSNSNDSSGVSYVIDSHQSRLSLSKSRLCRVWPPGDFHTKQATAHDLTQITRRLSSNLISALNWSHDSLCLSCILLWPPIPLLALCRLAKSITMWLRAWSVNLDVMLSHLLTLLLMMLIFLNNKALSYLGSCSDACRGFYLLITFIRNWRQ